LILLQNLKSIIKSGPIWLWGISFVAFWLFMGVFIFTSDFNIPKSMIHSYAGIWFSLDSVISVSSVGVTMAFSIYYSSNSMAYLFRNSKLTPMRYYLDSVLSSGIAFVVLGLILTGLTGLFFFIKFHTLVLPNLLIYSVALFFISGIIFYSLSSILVLLFNNWLGLKNINFISFISLFIGMGFGYTILYSQIPVTLLYGNFINPLEYLYIYSYDAQVPNVVLINPYSKFVNLDYAVISVIIWITILIIASIIAIKNIRGCYIEEARMT
jgi:hypothetical protein